ncbi:MAG: hypothetical protein IT582_05045 [Opitutaceae bacterium]|nr:hypothetical protein [Opitutaceae bacterium]
MKRWFCLFIIIAVPLAAQPREETLAERGLRQLVERQRTLLAAAAKAGDNFDEPAFTTQMQQLCQAYESFLRDNPGFAAGYAAYGYLLGKIGMEREGVVMLLKANQYDPDIPLVKNQIGNYLAEHGKPLEAVNYYLAAIKLAPKEPLYHFQLGTLLHNSRDIFIKSGEWTADGIDNAMHEGFRKAAELGPDRFEYAYRYGESFYDLSHPDWDQALAVWAGLEERATTEIERQTMRLHAANVCLKAGKTAHAEALLASISLTELAAQKEKLVAQMAAAAKK